MESRDPNVDRPPAQVRHVLRAAAATLLLASTLVAVVPGDVSALPGPDPVVDTTLIGTSQGGGPPAQVVISQVYGGGGNSGATYVADFVELVNRGGSPQDLAGWSIQYAAAASTNWSPPGANTLSGTIAPGARYLIAIPTTGTTGAPLPSADAVWGALGSGGMAATSGKVALVTDAATLPTGACPGGASVADAVGYGTQSCAAIAIAGGSVLSATRSAMRTPDRCSLTFASVTPPQPENSATPATPCGGPPPPLDPDVPIGSTVRYRTTVGVPEGVTAGLSLIDTLDEGLAFVSFDSISTSSPAVSASVPGGFPAVRSGGTVSDVGSGPTAAGRRVTFDFGTVTNSDSDPVSTETITLIYTAVVLNAAANVAGATRSNQASVAVGATVVGPSASADDAVVTEPDLAVTKVADTTTAAAGDVVTYTVTVVATSTASTSAAHEVALSDALPPGITYVADSLTHAGGEAPTTLSGTANPVSASWSVLQPGQSSTLTLQGVVDAGAPFLGPTATNTARVTATSLAGAQGPSLSPYNTLGVERTGDTADVGGAANTYLWTGAAVVDVSSADLVILKRHTGDFTTGRQGRFTISVTNDGPSPAAGPLTVSDQLPAGLTYLGATSAGDAWDCSATAGQLVTCTLVGPPLGSGATAPEIVLTVAIVPDALPSITNAATVASATPDPDPDDNRSTDVVTVLPAADLAIEKTHPAGEILVGDELTYAITVSNLGPIDDPGPITVEDVLPAGLTFVDGSGDGWDCAATGSAVSCRHAGSLRNGAVTTIALTVAVGPAAAPEAMNAATVTGTIDPDPDNNTAVDSATITAVSDLTLAKTLDGGALTAGSPAVYVLTVTNRGPSPAAGPITIVDRLPAGLVYRSANGDGWSCTEAGAEVTCVNPSTLPVGDSSTVRITVVVEATSGTVVNRATATSATRNASGTPSVTAEVAAEVASREPSAPSSGEQVPSSPSSLAFTGGEVWTWLWGALAMILLGSGLVIVARRRAL